VADKLNLDKKTQFFVFIFIFSPSADRWYSIGDEMYPKPNTWVTLQDPHETLIRHYFFFCGKTLSAS
jgi:hypothetical protein